MTAGAGLGGQRRADLWTATGLLVLGVVVVVLESGVVVSVLAPDVGGLRAVGGTLLAGVAVALAQRPAPAAAILLAGAAVFGSTADSALVWLLLVAWVRVLVAVGRRGRGALVALVAVAATAVSLFSDVLQARPVPPDDVAYAPLFLLPIAIGLGLRAVDHRRSGRAAEAERRARHDEQRAVAAQRGEIARELHDVVARHVSAMVVAAEAAVRALDRDPEAAGVVLDDAAGSARRSLAAMEHMVDALDGAAGDVTGDRPGLDDLDGLVEEAARGGCAVRLDVRGDLATVPSDVGLHAYRILQEGLANARRHAGATSATVEVEATARALRLRVHDGGPPPGGPPPAGPRSGHGLVGVAERVRLHGGSWSVGPAAGAGWSLDVLVPLDPDPPPVPSPPAPRGPAPAGRTGRG